MHFAQLLVLEREHRRIFSVEPNLDQWKRLHGGKVTLCIPPVSRRGEREEEKIEEKKRYRNELVQYEMLDIIKR